MRASQEELTQKAIKMQDYLSSQYGQEPQELLARIEYLTILIAQSGKLLADAKYYQDEIINGAITEAFKKVMDLPASTLNQFVKSSAKEQNYLVNILDRINSSATHQLDGIRSILSYKKSEMQIM